MPSEMDILPPSTELMALINYCKSINTSMLLGCDANSHHTIWGSANCNAKGDALLDYILSSNLTILNRGNEPTFYN